MEHRLENRKNVTVAVSLQYDANNELPAVMSNLSHHGAFIETDCSFFEECTPVDIQYYVYDGSTYRTDVLHAIVVHANERGIGVMFMMKFDCDDIVSYQADEPLSNTCEQRSQQLQSLCWSVTGKRKVQAGSSATIS